MFNPVKNTRVYEQVVEQIKEMVKNGTVKRGEKLPTERDMAEQLQVSRASVREALRALEVVGLIESKQGSGNFIKENLGGALLEPLSIMFMLQDSSPRDIFELREVLELETSALAVSKITDEELEILKSLIEELKNSDDEDKNVVIDKNFHYTIAKASHNLLMLNVLEVLSQLMDEFIKDSRKNILADYNNKEKLIEIHEELYKALKNRDKDRVYHIMVEHFELIGKFMD